MFYDEGPNSLDAFFTRVMSDGMPVVGMHDALLHVRPSQMPGIKGHSIGNSNVVKAEVLFDYLRKALNAVPSAAATKTNIKG